MSFQCAARKEGKYNTENKDKCECPALDFYLKQQAKANKLPDGIQEKKLSNSKQQLSNTSKQQLSKQQSSISPRQQTPTNSKQHLPTTSKQQLQDFISNTILEEKLKTISEHNELVESEQEIPEYKIEPEKIFGAFAKDYGPNHENAGFLCTTFIDLREPVIVYEEHLGIPRSTEHTFFGLISTLFNSTYQALLTVYDMLLHMLPVLGGLLYIMRFVLDKAIDICLTSRARDKIFKIVLFSGELVIIFFILYLLLGVLVLPLCHLIVYAGFRLWHVVTPC